MRSIVPIRHPATRLSYFHRIKTKVMTATAIPPQPVEAWPAPPTAERGWMKTVAGLRKTKYRGIEKVGWAFTLAAAAYNLIRLPKLLAEPG